MTALAVRDAYSIYVAAKQAQGASDRYLQDLRSRLGRLADAFSVNVDAVTTPALQAWLDGLKLSAQTMRNFRTVLVGFFRFCRSRGWCAGNPASELTVPKLKGDAEPEIFTVEEFSRLLHAAPISFLPAIALGGFGGLRSSEIERIHWEDINLATGEVVVRRGKAKTRSRRIVPLCEAGRAWLLTCKDRKGQVWAGKHEDFYDAQKATAKATEVRDEKDAIVTPALRWKTNGLRHGFASHRLAITGDAVRVAHEMGNSAEVVHRDYKALVGEAEGRAWFSIAPKRHQTAATSAITQEAA